MELKITPRPFQKPALRLTLTPSLRQSLHVLQMPVVELRNFLKEKIEENPILEEDEKILELDQLLESYFKNNNYDTDWVGIKEGKLFPDENLAAKKPSLEEHLLHQLRMVRLTEEEYRIGEYLIESLDENGYLNISLEEAALNLNLPCKEVEKLFLVIQGFDPPGVGARNLTECLLSQLESKGIKNSLAAKIVERGLDDLAKKRYKALLKKFKVSIDSVKEAEKEISRLEPKPGRAFVSSEATAIVPDIILKETGAGYKVELNEEELPKLGIKKNYIKMFKDKNTPENTKKFLKEHMNSALWIFKAVNERRKTMRKVINCIFDLQKQVIENGPASMVPMTLKDIAGMTGLHASTVSRAVKDKYAQTPYGTIRIKDFFSNEIKSENGGHVSAESIKREIRELVTGQNREQPLSDSGILEVLNKKGVTLSRRTVAKYRNQLNVLPSYLRKNSLSSTYQTHHE